MRIKTPVKGGICESLMGRDKGNLYAVLEVLSADYLLVVDGKLKKLSCPKKKNLKHVRLINANASEYGADFSNGKVHDSEIAYALKQYAKQIKVGG